MNAFIKPLAVVVLMGLSVNAFAVQKDITINASVDAALDITQSDASSLPTAVTMEYISGTGLAPYAVQAKIWSNLYSDVNMSIVNPVILTDRAGSATTIPVTVSYGASTITTTPTLLAKTALFPGGAASLSTGSVAQPLTFKQTTPGVLTSGNYTGVVSLYLSQVAAAL